MDSGQSIVYKITHSQSNNNWEKTDDGQKGVCVCSLYSCMKRKSDTISRNKIWKNLRNKNIVERLIKALWVFTEANNQVRMCNKLSSTFITNEGMRQCCVINPLLFLCSMDEAMEECQSKTVKFVVGYISLKPVYLDISAFADDIILFANSGMNLQKKLHIRMEVSEMQNLHPNVGKPKLW